MPQRYGTNRRPVVYPGGPTWESYHTLRACAELGADGLHSLEAISKVAGVALDEVSRAIEIMRANMLFRMKRLEGVTYYNINRLGQERLARCVKVIQKSNKI